MYRHLFLFFFYVQVNHVKMGRKHSQIYYQEGSTFRDNDDNNKKKNLRRKHFAKQKAPF